MTGYLYVAGPMTGLPEFNYPAFREATGRLRAAGMTVHSPHELHGGDVSQPYETYLEAGLAAARAAAAVVLLAGWELSPGARAERAAALAAGVPVFILDQNETEGASA